MAINKETLSMRDTPSIRQLRAFAAVYRLGQLSAAARQLSLTQPAVTVLLRELEDKLGVRLFDRTTRSLQPTQAAVEAIVHAERVLAELQDMHGAMAELASSRRGRLRVAATSTVAQTLLPGALRRFGAQHPGVRVVVDDCAPGEFVQRIASGRVDLGIGTLETAVPALVERVFLREPLVAAAPASGSFQPGRDITWKALARLPLVTVRAGYGVRQRIERAAAEAGVTLQVTQEVSLLTTALALAAAGLGVAVVPASVAARMAWGDMAVRRITRPTVTRSVAVVSLAGRSLPPAAEAFAGLLESGFRSTD